MTGLRQRMLEELQRRNYSPTTIRCYLRVVEGFARYFGKRPDHLTQEHMREYHLHLLQKRKLTPKTVGLHIAALRFFLDRKPSPVESPLTENSNKLDKAKPCMHS